MKIILLQNVPGLGQKNEVKNVKTGYWRNFLLPGNLAAMATPRLIEQLSHRKEKKTETKEYKEIQLAKLLEDLNGQTLKIVRKAGEKGTLFDGIDAKELVKEIAEKMRFELPLDLIKLEKPIKKIGVYEVLIGDSKLNVEIIAEQD